MLRAPSFVLLVIAVVLFAVAGYLTADRTTKLLALAWMALTLALLLR